MQRAAGRGRDSGTGTGTFTCTFTGTQTGTVTRTGRGTGTSAGRFLRKAILSENTVPDQVPHSSTSGEGPPSRGSNDGGKSRPGGYLDYERLDVYRCAIEFLAIAVKIGDSLPRGYSDLRDHLRRASPSIALNIAEGAGKTRKADKARFYSIARGSAMECGAVLDATRVLHAADEALLGEGKALLVRIVSMLSKMAH